MGPRPSRPARGRRELGVLASPRRPRRRHDRRGRRPGAGRSGVPPQRRGAPSPPHRGCSPCRSARRPPRASATDSASRRRATCARCARSARASRPIFAQQSIREMTRTGRTPIEVMDDATWGQFAEGWRGGTGADADHLKTTADIDVCLAAGFAMFTIDPGEHVDSSADTADLAALRAKAGALPWARPRGHGRRRAQALPRPDVRGRAPEDRLRRGDAPAGRGEVRPRRRPRRPDVAPSR